MLDKHPFLRDYQVKPFSNNGFTNRIIVVFVLSLVLFLYLSGLFKFVLGIISLISLLFVLSNLYFRLKNKWARIHYPVWVDYSGALGYLASKKGDSPTQDDINNAFLILLSKLFNGEDETKLKSLLKDILGERIKLEDETFLKRLFKDRHPDMDGGELDSVISEIRNDITNPKDMGINNRINISLIIGTLIEVKYGTKEKEEYFYNIITNKAK